MAATEFPVLHRPTTRRKRPILRIIFIFLGAVIVLLGVVILIARLGKSALDYPGKPASGELLYASNFDSYNDEWEQFPGQDNATVADGMLKISVNSTSGVFSRLDHAFSNFDLHVNAIRLAAQDTDNELGVLFRVQDISNYYIFRIRGDGAYRVELCKNCDGTTIDVLSEWQFSPAILTGLNQVNQLRIVAKDDHFIFFVNDQPLKLCLKGSDRRSTWTGLDTGQCLSNNKQTSDELIDSTFAWGQIGLGVNTTTPGVEVGFNDVLLYGPQ